MANIFVRRCRMITVGILVLLTSGIAIVMAVVMVFVLSIGRK